MFESCCCSSWVKSLALEFKEKNSWSYKDHNHDFFDENYGYSKIMVDFGKESLIIIVFRETDLIHFLPLICKN